MSAAPWWKNAVIYQVYVRSFADSDGDGTGDIGGIRSRLTYLRDLGVDGIWVNPWYPSPLNDGGYDVADYRRIDSRYGTLQDAKALIDDAHALDLRVLVDLVPNHTSSEHAWFSEAISSPPGHPSRDRYHILPGAGADGSEPPNNWKSVFGGPAWTRLPDGEWYLHLFDPTQPDLNWTNPEVQDEFCDILRFWLDLGADGFRVDVAHGLAKDTTYPDHVEESELLVSSDERIHPFWDRDDTHTYVRQWRRVLNSYPGDRMMVAEAWVAPQRVPMFLRPDEYHQSFAFSFLDADWDAAELEASIRTAVETTAGAGALPTWTLSNHDVVRHATRYGLPKGTDWRHWLLDGPHDVLDPPLGRRRARAAILLMLALPGSAYLYQGEELGLPEVWDLPLDVLDDPVWHNSGHANKGRDGCRVPIPWTRGGPSYGFGAGRSWLPQPAIFGSLSVEAQTGVTGSFLELYRSALELRRTVFPSAAGITWPASAPDGVLAFERPGGVQCWINFGAREVGLPEGADLLLGSESSVTSQRRLPGDAAVWFR